MFRSTQRFLISIRCACVASAVLGCVVLAGLCWQADTDLRADDAQQLQHQETLDKFEMRDVHFSLRQLGLSEDELAAIVQRLAKVKLTKVKPDQRQAELVASPEFKAVVAELRGRFAFQSLADRLAFEKGTRKVGTLTADTRKQLDYVDDYFDRKNNERHDALSRLHSDKVASFITTEGLGVERTFHRSFDKDIELATLSSKSLLTPAEAGTAVTLPSTAASAGGKQLMPARDELAHLHLSGQLDFLNAKKLGLIKERRVAAGFQPHGFGHTPVLYTQAAKKDDMERWLVRRLELVSLLKHAAPAVYDSATLPRMEQLAHANVKTRPLADFESKALAALERGDDLVTEATTNTIRMVGSIRAAKQCQSCHDCERGALLGAFTYYLERTPSVRK